MAEGRRRRKARTGRFGSAVVVKWTDIGCLAEVVAAADFDAMMTEVL